MPDAGSLIDRGADCGGDCERAAFAGAFRAVRAGSVALLDRGRIEAERGILDGRNPVVERSEIENAAVGAEGELFHQRVPESHYRRAFVLSLDLLRVQRPADIADERQPADHDHATA